MGVGLVVSSGSRWWEHERWWLTAAALPGGAWAHLVAEARTHGAAPRAAIGRGLQVLLVACIHSCALAVAVVELVAPVLGDGFVPPADANGFVMTVSVAAAGGLTFGLLAQGAWSGLPITSPLLHPHRRH